jgi:hypothetical protein
MSCGMCARLIIESYTWERVYLSKASLFFMTDILFVKVFRLSSALFLCVACGVNAPQATTAETLPQTQLKQGAPPFATPSVEEQLSGEIANIKNQLTNSSLDKVTRRRLEWQLSDDEKSLQDHITNTMLWAKLTQARFSHDPDRIANAETKLADYLAKKLGAIEGKNYPTGMSLEKVTDLINAHLGRGSYWSDKKPLIRIILLAFLLLPPLVMVFLAIKKRIKKH